MKGIKTITVTNMLLFNCMLSVAGEKPATKPNFIIINCDDLGYGDLGCFGHPTILTPHLDRMAYEGQKWTSFYVSASVSSPSRAGLLTGRLGVRTGMYGNEREVLFPDSPKGLPQNELTIASLLEKAGYTNACVGKWHLGNKEGSMPWNHGFNYYYGIPYSNEMSKKEQAIKGNQNYRFELPFYNQQEILEWEPDQTQLTKRLTEYAIDFIEKEKKHPFFLYLAHPMPHVPLYASGNFQNKSLRGKYGDAVEEIDWSVGQILHILKKNGLDEHTLVIFMSDNGPWLTYGWEGGSAGLLKDGKASTCEGGFRVPCIFWGNKITSSLVTGMGSTLDILPTLCEMAGVALPTNKKYDGFSLVKALVQKEKTPRQLYPFFRGNELYAFRKDNYKIHFISREAYGSKDRTIHDIPLLYDIERDPEEKQNIAFIYPEIVRDLIDESEKYMATIFTLPSIFDLSPQKNE